MQILMYNPSGKNSAPLRRMFEQNRIRVEECKLKEHCLSMAMSDLYAALVYLFEGTHEELALFYQHWKKEGCQSLFVVLTSRQSAVERAQGLEMGIHHYYLEPYSYMQILTEILVYEHKRYVEERQCYATERFEVDLLSRTITFDKEQLRLTRVEFDLLALLIRRRGAVLSRVQIWEEIWGYQDYPLANTIDVHMNRLRKKFPESARDLIKTIYGIGYQMPGSV